MSASSTSATGAGGGTGGPSATVSVVSTPINAGARPDSAPALGSSQASTPPNPGSSAGSASGGKFLDPRSAAAAITTVVSPPTPADDRKSRRTSLMVPLPKRPSMESLSPSPGPASPGISGWNESSPKIDSGFPDKQSNNDAAKLNRKESYKAQRKNYRREKKRVASELLNSLQDPAVIVLADWLKIRGTLKSWTKLWCVLKPGLLFIYKSPKTKSSHWVGTVLLTSCQVIERPSKKDGFCFKLFHPMDQTIWAPRGPDKETMGAVVQPLPTSYLIFRAPSQAAGKCWLDALELSLRCSALLVRSVPAIDMSVVEDLGTASSTHETQWSEADYEKHFDEHDLDIDSQPDQGTLVMSAGESDSESDMGEGMVEVEEFPETPYVHSPEEEFGAAGEQVEELPEEHKSLIWFLVKQVRPGMDLSKVVLPTFILEPRSFLDKLADSYYHADLLSKAVLEDDPFTRMKTVVQWYLSGFYKKPKGLKKPYNPILGETFRCYWQHENGSRTFYIAEQVSHHPPISVFYVTNRQDGFCISCSILAKSKFYGNSTSAILEGVATLTLLPRGESYTLTVPYAHCKGILMGTLSMELGGKVSVECENTGYKTELEFKLKPFLGGNEYINIVTGKLKLGKETLATINGHWDGEIRIKDSRTGEDSVLFNPTTEVRAQRLKRFTVPMESQGTNESERLWQHVAAAIRRDDQVGATEEKTALEEAQRISAKERKATCTEWIPGLFQQDLVTGQYHYKYADLRPWDPRNDLRQYESNYRIQTKTRHQAPMVRTASVVSSDPLSILQVESRGSLRKTRALTAGVLKSRKISSNTSTPDLIDPNSDSSHSNDVHDSGLSNTRVIQSLDDINRKLEEHSKKLSKLQLDMDKIYWAPKNQGGSALGGLVSPTTLRGIAFGVLALLLQIFIAWYLTKRSLAAATGSGSGGAGSTGSQ
ncbi:oxysterol-binding protein-related protein 8 isoform X6 [Culex quinquefasciatus]|uniref:oxysterol-binding protein-related protein 8 isoform X6 n=1 Tax=Culex quinquefasciatus TaxID=7176 RepID=UPI0018E36723|nr:oxysterol-binding protein-related protein 8 isoform X6 [Culex quinquefasciatus]